MPFRFRSRQFNGNHGCLETSRHGNSEKGSARFNSSAFNPPDGKKRRGSSLFNQTGPYAKSIGDFRRENNYGNSHMTNGSFPNSRDGIVAVNGRTTCLRALPCIVRQMVRTQETVAGWKNLKTQEQKNTPSRTVKRKWWDVRGKRWEKRGSRGQPLHFKTRNYFFAVFAEPQITSSAHISNIAKTRKSVLTVADYHFFFLNS